MNWQRIGKVSVIAGRCSTKAKGPEGFPGPDGLKVYRFGGFGRHATNTEKAIAKTVPKVKTYPMAIIIEGILRESGPDGNRPSDPVPGLGRNCGGY